MKSEKLLHAIGTIDDGLIFAARPAEKKKTPRTRIVWTAAAAAVLALILAIGVGAAGDFESLENLFGPAFPGARQSSLDPELIARLGAPVGVSVTDNGVAVTVDSVVRDRYNCTLVLTVEKSDIDGKGFLFDRSTLKVGGAEFTGPAASSSDSVSGDGKARYVVSWMGDESVIPGGKAAVVLENLVINSHGVLTEQTVPGRWELEFDMGYADQSADLPTGQTLSVECAEITVNQVTISPLSIRVISTAKLTEADMEAVLDHNGKSVLRERLEWPDIVILKKDGTRIANRAMRDPQQGGDSHIQNGWGNSEQKGGVLECQCSLVFDQPVLLEDLESVSIEGVEIPLNGLEAVQ